MSAQALLSIEPNPIPDFLIYAKFSGSEFKKAHWYRKNKLYFNIECCYQNRDDTRYYTFFQSYCSSNMEFEQFQISYSKLKAITDDPTIPLRIRFFDSVGNENRDKMIGECYTTVEELKHSIGRSFVITRINKKGETENSGSFIIDSFRIQPLFTFNQYVQAGLKISLAVAIDMNYINRSYPDLHKPGTLNNYEQILLSALEILLPYLAGEGVACYALGISHKLKFSQVANLSLKKDELYLHGIKEVVDTYRENVSKVSFDGASWFGPIITETANLAETHFKNFKTYTIALILTTGKWNDRLETIEALTKASHSPISYIFINIGPENQLGMIDANDKPLIGLHSIQARDCVRYIFYRDIIDHHLSLDQQMMHELPSQVSIWADMKGLRPEYFAS